MFNLGSGGGQVVSVFAFHSDDPSSNPAEIYNFSVKLLLKRTSINKKESGVGPFLKKNKCSIKFMPMTGFELHTFGIGSTCFAI